LKLNSFSAQSKFCSQRNLNRQNPVHHAISKAPAA
jgi:hypothetical protein